MTYLKNTRLVRTVIVHDYPGRLIYRQSIMYINRCVEDNVPVVIQYQTTEKYDLYVPRVAEYETTDIREIGSLRYNRIILTAHLPTVGACIHRCYVCMCLDADVGKTAVRYGILHFIRRPRRPRSP